MLYNLILKDINNIKRLLVYPLALVLFFGLTANECLDAVENLTVDVPTTIEESFELKVDEAGDFEFIDKLDLNSPEVEEYRERIQNFNVTDVNFTVVDNIQSGSASINSFDVRMIADGRNFNMFLNGDSESLIRTFEEVTAEDLERLKDHFGSLINDVEDPNVDFVATGTASGPAHYTITMTIDGVLEASAN